MTRSLSRKVSVNPVLLRRQYLSNYGNSTLIKSIVSSPKIYFHSRQSVREKTGWWDHGTKLRRSSESGLQLVYGRGTRIWRIRGLDTRFVWIKEIFDWSDTIRQYGSLPSDFVPCVDFTFYIDWLYIISLRSTSKDKSR